ncbi:MAG: hypothetical protein GX625_05650, partial [Clostridiaceae bacterium]|nr:hypothetical protein [Clostridiaceae bacterium]
FLRIIKPSGAFVFLYNRLNKEEGFLEDFQKLLDQYSIHAENDDHTEVLADEIVDFFGSTAYSHVSVPNRQSIDYEGVKARFLSEITMSQCENVYYEMLDKLQNIFDRYNQDRKVTLNYTTEAYIGGLGK